MGICQRVDGRWVVRYKSENVWKQKTFRDEAEARAFDREKSDALLDSARMTLLEGVVAFLRNVPHCEKRIKAYKRLLLVDYARELKDRFIDTLTRRDLELVRETCRAAGCAAITINTYTDMLSAALNWCAEQDFILSNPWAKYKDLPEKRKTRTASLEDFKRIFPHLKPWMQWAAQTAIALCLRPGVKELFSLRWSAFHWREGFVEVYMSKVDATKHVYPSPAYLELAAEKRSRAKETDFVCPCPRRQFGTGYASAWKTACSKAGVTGFPMYALRHLAASMMIAGGADVAAVAAQLGHKNITTTGEYYIHAVSGAQRRAGALLDLVQNQDLVQTNSMMTPS